jgi:hypothetical protein
VSGLRAKKFRVKERKKGGAGRGGLRDKNGETVSETKRGGDGLRFEG